MYRIARAAQTVRRSTRLREPAAGGAEADTAGAVQVAAIVLDRQQRQIAFLTVDGQAQRRIDASGNFIAEAELDRVHSDASRGRERCGG